MEKKEEFEIDEYGSKHFFNVKLAQDYLATHYELQEVLGEGTWGEVRQACAKPEKNCDWAMKRAILPYEKDDAGQTEQEQMEKDVYFLKLLQSKRIQDKQIVPTFRESWFYASNVKKNQDGAYYIVMEGFDINMHALGKEIAAAAKIAKPAMLFTRPQLYRMFEIAALLPFFDLDIKADQFLYRASDDLVVLIDFGFAGGGLDSKIVSRWGWPGNEGISTTCPAAWSPLQLCSDMKNVCSSTSSRDKECVPCPSNIQEYVTFVNVSLLEQFFLLFGPTYVQNSDGTNLQLFGGLDGLDRDRVDNLCRGWTNETWQQQNHRNSLFKRSVKEIAFFPFSSILRNSQLATYTDEYKIEMVHDTVES